MNKTSLGAILLFLLVLNLFALTNNACAINVKAENAKKIFVFNENFDINNDKRTRNDFINHKIGLIKLDVAKEKMKSLFADQSEESIKKCNDTTDGAQPKDPNFELICSISNYSISKGKESKQDIYDFTMSDILPHLVEWRRTQDALSSLPFITLYTADQYAKYYNKNKKYPSDAKILKLDNRFVNNDIKIKLSSDNDNLISVCNTLTNGCWIVKGRMESNGSKRLYIERAGEINSFFNLNNDEEGIIKAIKKAFDLPKAEKDKWQDFLGR